MRNEAAPVRIKRFVGITLLGIVCAAVFAVSALAAVNYVYKNGYTGPGGMGNDFTVYYRNYNDSCAGDPAVYGLTKSIYGLSNGSWVASTTTFNGCSNSKAHLGPSSNYGYTYVQSKCKNVDSVTLLLVCNTTRPS
jgi:hypothetical protein